MMYLLKTIYIVLLLTLNPLFTFAQTKPTIESVEKEVKQMMADIKKDKLRAIPITINDLECKKLHLSVVIDFDKNIRIISFQSPFDKQKETVSIISYFYSKDGGLIKYECLYPDAIGPNKERTVSYYYNNFAYFAAKSLTPEVKANQLFSKWPIRSAMHYWIQARDQLGD